MNIFDIEKAYQLLERAIDIDGDPVRLADIYETAILKSMDILNSYIQKEKGKQTIKNYNNEPSTVEKLDRTLKVILTNYISFIDEDIEEIENLYFSDLISLDEKIESVEAKSYERTYIFDLLKLHNLNYVIDEWLDPYIEGNLNHNSRIAIIKLIEDGNMNLSSSVWNIIEQYKNNFEK